MLYNVQSDTAIIVYNKEGHVISILYISSLVVIGVRINCSFCIENECKCYLGKPREKDIYWISKGNLINLKVRQFARVVKIRTIIAGDKCATQ